jgi:uncharacterized RDD family membrane protein YckC
MNLGADRLQIAGLTGVDVGLEIAGPGSRSYAFLIDWQIRLLVALGWFSANWLFARHARPFTALALLPALGVYFLYHPVLEVLMRGRTPGKRRAGVRIATRSGGTPGTGALLIRNIFRLIDSLPALYLLGLVCCLMTAQRVRIGDLAAGTLLVVEAGAPTDSLSQLGSVVSHNELSPAVVELIQELLERWPSLEWVHRDELARALLARVGSATDAPLPADLSDHELRERLRILLAQRVRA